AMPVNFRFVIEGMEEAGSLGLENLLEEEKHRFFSDVDYIVISDNLWLSNKKPALTYGSRGNACFSVECGSKDLHSGTFGGIIHEPLTDLIALLDSLVDPTGHIQIPGIYDSVAALTEEERKLYESIEFDLEEHKNNSGVKKFLFGTKNDSTCVLKRSSSVIDGVSPGLPIGGQSRSMMMINMAKAEILFQGVLVSPLRGSCFVAASGKFTTEHNLREVVTYPYNLIDFYRTTQQHLSNLAKLVFGADPDFIRDGSTIPVARMFQTVMQKSVMMLPIGSADDGEHSQNEKIRRHNYIEGTKLFAAFFLEISKLH
ncbi:CNDP1 dipeptidase, partial [Neopipo cinnamomea]|nr:CNDP1 dipeptidase [Neopipo cinnamomea]